MNPQSHQHAHGHAAGEHGDSESALAELLDLDAEVLAGYLAGLTAWVAESAPPPVARIIDLGSGTGTGTFALLRRFPDAHVTAVDVAPDRLSRLRHRAGELGLAGRVEVVAADLDEPWPNLGPADLVWASMALHHLADPDRALAQVFGLLRPGGSLAVAETTATESFPRFLPDGADAGLEDRLHALLGDLHTEQVPELGSDWAARLTAAGFTIAAERAFVVALEPPLPARAGRYAQLSLDRMRSGLAGRLGLADQHALAVLAAGDGPGSIRNREDLTVRATRPAWLARRPAWPG
jgi:SAM-dependent methyltransferase